MRAVDDGVFVSDLERTYFMGGGDPGEAVLIDKDDYPAILYTAQKIDAARVGGLGLSGNADLWLFKTGVCMGGGGGQIKNLTENHFRIQEDLDSGAAIVWKVDSSYQFICMIAA